MLREIPRESDYSALTRKLFPLLTMYDDAAAPDGAPPQRIGEKKLAARYACEALRQVSFVSNRFVFFKKIIVSSVWGSFVDNLTGVLLL
jgi:hypothetical protein